MRKIIIIRKLLLAIYLVVQALFSNLYAQQPQKVLLQKQAIISIRAITAQDISGSIAVIHEAGADLRIETYVQGAWNSSYTDSELKAKAAAQYNISVKEADGKLSVEVVQKEQPANWKEGVSLSFIIYAPQQVSIDAKTAGGSISLQNIHGNQSFTTLGGSLNLVHVNGGVNGKTTGGSINLDKCNTTGTIETKGGSIAARSSQGNMALFTLGGSLQLTDLDGNYTVKTSGGSISANNIKGQLNAHTSGGSVNMQNMQCQLDASTVGGSMRVAFKRLPGSVLLKNASGNIAVSLPVSAKIDLDVKANTIAYPNFPVINGKVTKEIIKAAINGGGNAVKIEAANKVSIGLEETAQ